MEKEDHKERKKEKQGEKEEKKKDATLQKSGSQAMGRDPELRREINVDGSQGRRKVLTLSVYFSYLTNHILLLTTNY